MSTILQKGGEGETAFLFDAEHGASRRSSLELVRLISFTVASCAITHLRSGDKGAKLFR